MAQNKLIIGKDGLYAKAIDKTTYSNVDIVLLSVLPSDAKQPTSLVDGCVRILDDKGSEISEVEDISIDSSTNAGKFCIGSDKIIKLIVTKASVSDLTAAKTKFNGMTVYYDYREDLKLDEKNFDLKIFDSTGGKIYDSCPITLEQAMNMVNIYSKTFDVKEMGVPKYQLTNMLI